MRHEAVREKALFPQIFACLCVTARRLVMLKKLSSEVSEPARLRYQLYACGNFLSKPWRKIAIPGQPLGLTMRSFLTVVGIENNNDIRFITVKNEAYWRNTNGNLRTWRRDFK